MAQFWCQKCHSDVEGVHYGQCPDHPTNLALAGRGGLPPKQASSTAARPTNTTNTKAAFFKGESTISFDDDQMKQIVEYFLLNVLDLSGVEVVKLKHSKFGSKVTFSQRPEEPVEEVFVPGVQVAAPYTADELAALQELEDEMAREREANQGN